MGERTPTETCISRAFYHKCLERGRIDSCRSNLCTCWSCTAGMDVAVSFAEMLCKVGGRHPWIQLQNVAAAARVFEVSAGVVAVVRWLLLLQLYRQATELCTDRSSTWVFFQTHPPHRLLPVQPLQDDAELFIHTAHHQGSAGPGTDVVGCHDAGSAADTGEDCAPIADTSQPSCHGQATPSGHCQILLGVSCLFGHAVLRLFGRAWKSLQGSGLSGNSPCVLLVA